MMSLDNAVVLAVSGDLFASAPAQTLAEFRKCSMQYAHVVVVVGASSSDAKGALAQTTVLPPHTDESVHAWLLTEPQRRTAARLGAALEEAGISARVLDASEIGPTTDGQLLDAQPRSLNARAIVESWRESRVVIIPAGGARSEDSRPALVGGGHPLTTAAFVASVLALPLWYLVDEVEAERWNDRDVLELDSYEPWASGASPRSTLASLPLRDVRARLFAERRGVEFDVVAVSSRSLTRCGPRAASFESQAAFASRSTLLPGATLNEIKRDGRAQIARSRDASQIVSAGWIGDALSTHAHGHARPTFGQPHEGREAV